MRRAVTATALTSALLLAACGNADNADNGPAAGVATPVTIEQVPATAVEDVPSALVDMTAPELPTPLVDPADIRAGGPPPDGIPPIDEPVFIPADSVDFLEDNEPVLAIEINGDARAYPVQILIWHEIVNDTIGGEPVAVTYCPLCNSAVAVDRRIDDRVVTFGTSGSLYQSALVMYDRQTESLWSHFTGQAIAGVLTGNELDTLPLATVGWAEWRDAHPGGLVLSRDTGHDRDYGRNPYPGYDDVDNPPFLFDGEVDGRLVAKERVVGVGIGDQPIAIRHDTLLEEGVIDFELGGRPHVAWVLPGTASALEATSVSGGRDVGATGVFDATVEGQTLTFRSVDGGFEDAQTGSRWDVLGHARSGPLEGVRLRAVEHLDTFWFAWAAFSPDTELVS
ncbi:MAG: DUF3179 domain-containing protein [Acidimicrobiia bacterium]|nr:DUF3179 domain-containing protein [Acidimicrobiia bacterium]